MNLRIFITLFVFTGNICCAQNLIVNGDFEDYTTCPWALSQLDFAQYWINPTTVNGGTPDYYNACCTSTWVGVPKNNFGFQNAYSGSAYGGVITSYA